jgi:hypothetical protein
MTLGYAEPGYAAALEDIGTPIHLPCSNGWLLKRAIPHSAHVDAMGCYPLFACQHWEGLRGDLDQLEDVVSVAAVIDPFADCSVSSLRSAFRDVVHPFKQHYVIDLARSPRDYVASHHRRNARKALADVSVSVETRPADHLSDWIQLYRLLIERHGIDDHRAFSPRSFEAQLSMPSMVATIARQGESIVAMALWLRGERVVYYHLGAANPAGYACRANFSLFACAIEYFADVGYAWINLGGGAGLHAGPTDGLARFKRGWATGTRTAHFCGRIYQRDVYETLSARVAAPDSGLFPQYRWQRPATLGFPAAITAAPPSTSRNH